MMTCELASFSCQARGIKFYEVETSEIAVGDLLNFQLEPDNEWDSNCISIWVTGSGSARKLGNLAREAAVYLSPLLSSGLQASG